MAWLFERPFKEKKRLKLLVGCHVKRSCVGPFGSSVGRSGWPFERKRTGCGGELSVPKPLGTEALVGLHKEGRKNTTPLGVGNCCGSAWLFWELWGSWLFCKTVVGLHEGGRPWRGAVGGRLAPLQGGLVGRGRRNAPATEGSWGPS